MASGYKRDNRGRFAGGNGPGALGGKGAYAGRMSRPAASKAAVRNRRKGRLSAIGKKAAIYGGAYAVGVGAGIAARKLISTGPKPVKQVNYTNGVRTVTKTRTFSDTGKGRIKSSPTMYRGKGAGRVEDIGASVRGGSLRDAAFRSANPTLFKKFS